MFRRFFIAATLLACFISFCGIAGMAASHSSRYFPQNLSDEHTYQKSGRAVGDNAGWTDSITGTDGRYFQHSNYWGDGVVRLLRFTSNDKVVEQSRGKSILWYRFGDNQKEDWVMKLSSAGPACTDHSRLKIVSRSETVQVPAGTFTDCLKLEFSSGCADAGVLEQWFAPGVGLVKQVEDNIAGPVTSELVSAKVGNTTYPDKNRTSQK